MFQLNELTPLVKKRKRVGRGGSRGGTSGKGHKGQKARTGGKSKVRTAFEGGQMPLTRRLPKRGFNNYNFANKFEIVNIGTLEERCEAGDQVTREMLTKEGVVLGKSPIKLLAGGTLSKKLVVHVHAASKAAIEMIEAVGGKVELVKEI
ncbi:MAG TPA: 50S ribosomal protein L15 [Candidatus Babeliales bacterium]|nr:50S ribosomal protein L15 [Candidatus Babeliales bacterium]